MKKTTAIFAHLLSQGFDADTAFSISLRQETIHLLCYLNAEKIQYYHNFFPGKLESLNYCSERKAFICKFEHTVNDETCSIDISFFI